MLSRTILAQSILSEDQFIADLTSLFRRRNIGFGRPQDLERLASDLVADGAFRAALFNLCVVISHMGEVEFTPRELLVLVARASGGPGTFDAEGNIIIPHDTENAFLTGYEAWTHRDPELEAASEHRHSNPFHTAMQLSAAEGSRPAPSHAPISALSPASGPPRNIAPNAPLDSLTLAELRQYLDEIERRVSQIEPHLNNQAARNDQAAHNASPSAAHAEQIDALESEKLHEVIPFPHAPEPGPTPTAETLAPEPESIATVEETHTTTHEPEPIAIEETSSAEPELTHAAETPAPEPEPAPTAETLAPEPELIAIVEDTPAATPEPELIAVVEDSPAAETEPTHATESLPPVEVVETETTKIEEAPALAERPISLTSEAPHEASALAEEVAAAEVVIVPAGPLPHALQPEPTAGILVVEAVASDQATHAALDAARLRRLRVANIILAILLVISTIFAGFVAFRYFNSKTQPASLTATPDQAPATSLASPPVIPQTSPRTTPPATRPAAATGHDTKPPQTSEAASAATVPPDAVVFPPAVAPPDTTPPAPVVRQAPEPAPTAAASTPAIPPPAEPKPTEPAARPTQRNDAPPTPQVAVTTPAAAPATAPAPVPHPPEPVSATVNVSSSKMMAYAITKPAPVPPPTWHGNRETTVEVVAIISKEGKVTSAQALSGTPDVRPAAIQTMEAWRFKPYLVNGKPVEVITTFKFLFKGQ